MGGETPRSLVSVDPGALGDDRLKTPVYTLPDQEATSLQGNHLCTTEPERCQRGADDFPLG